MELKIEISNGLSILPFRCSTEVVRGIFGEPEETEELDNACDGSLESIAWNYDEKGLIFFFDVTSMEPSLSTIETDNQDAELFGEKIFKLKREELINLMKSKGFGEFEEEEETWGESRLTYEEAQIDFYFNDQDLSLVSWSCFE